MSGRATRRSAWWGMLLLLLLLLLHASRYGLCIQDDAFISFRYAYNLVHGHGLVYNPGERVEGYTNFLWTLMLAGVMALGINPLLAAAAGGVASVATLMLITWRMGRMEPASSPWNSLLAPALLAANGSLVLESVQGLETAFFCMLLMGGIRAVILEQAHPRRRPDSALWFSLAALTRPEAVLVYAWSQGFRLLWTRALPPARQRRGWLLFLLVVGAHFAFRLWYYGYPFPNTFYAKTGGGTAQLWRGLGYVGAFFWRYPGLGMLLALGARNACAVGRASRRFGPCFLLGTIVVYLAYVVAVGGDFKPTWRFVAPTLAPMALLAQAGLQAVARWPRRRLAWAAWFVLALTWTGRDAISNIYRARAEAAFRADTMYDLMTVGSFLRDTLLPGTLVAMHSAGTVAFVSGLPTIDMWGVADVHIAHMKVPGMGSGMPGHEKSDPQYVFDREPALYLPEEQLLTPQPTRLPMRSNFPADFQQHYQTFSLQVGDRWLNCFKRRDWKYGS